MLNESNKNLKMIPIVYFYYRKHLAKSTKTLSEIHKILLQYFVVLQADCPSALIETLWAKLLLMDFFLH